MQQLICVSSGWDLRWPDVFRIGQKTKIVATDSSKNIRQPFVIATKWQCSIKQTDSKLCFAKNTGCKLKKKKKVVWLHNCSSQYQTRLFHTTCHARPATNTTAALLHAAPSRWVLRRQTARSGDIRTLCLCKCRMRADIRASMDFKLRRIPHNRNLLTIQWFFFFKIKLNKF